MPADAPEGGLFVAVAASRSRSEMERLLVCACSPVAIESPAPEGLSADWLRRATTGGVDGDHRRANELVVALAVVAGRALEVLDGPGHQHRAGDDQFGERLGVADRLVGF